MLESRAARRQRLAELAPAIRADAWMTRMTAIVSAAIAAVTVVRAAQSTGYYWGDDYVHLLISRSVPGDPRALLDVWGRPLMTLAYVPGALVGDIGVRITSLALLFATALLCWDIAHRRRLPNAPSAALFLLAQPLTAMLGFAALPAILFSFILATAIWFRTRGRDDSAALVASLLPLTRLEGILVILVWAVVDFVKGRRVRHLPLLVLGLAGWAVVAAILYGDPLWLIHHSPYSLLARNSTYPPGGWAYLLYTWSPVLGPIVGALSLVAFLHPRRLDALDAWLVVAFAMFLSAIWGVPLLGSVPTGVYLVDISVPLALCASQALANIARPIRPSIVSTGIVLALTSAATLTQFDLGHLAQLALVVALIGLAWQRSETRQLVAKLPAFAAIALAGTAAAVFIQPILLTGQATVARQFAGSVVSRHLRVDISSDPVFAWFAGEMQPGIAGQFLSGPSLRSALEDAPPGTRLVWDMESGAPYVSREDLVDWGYTIEQGYGPLIIWVRQAS